MHWGLTLVSFGRNINGNEKTLGAVWYAKRPRSLSNIPFSGAQTLVLNWLYELLNMPPLPTSQAYSWWFQSKNTKLVIKIPSLTKCKQNRQRQSFRSKKFARVNFSFKAWQQLYFYVLCEFSTTFQLFCTKNFKVLTLNMLDTLNKQLCMQQ